MKTIENIKVNNGIQVIETSVKLRSGTNTIKPVFRNLFKNNEIENHFEFDEIGLIDMDENGNYIYDEEYIKTVQEEENNKSKNIFLNKEDLNNLNKEEYELFLSLLEFGRKYNIFIHIS